ncbi:glycosyltransferase family 2 protein [Dactylosporangium sp. NPDC000521]|uniref:glycosyltransferase family 2 protein n=1 Tax=Dactylosporangium sp. NPDC000521 TaxID=3363975 RepID=UPI0036C051FB
MTVLSIITPIYNPVAEYLLAAYESLTSQEMAEGDSWEWVVQEDGTTGIAQGILPNDDRISFGGGRPGGVAITRNLGLSRARGSLVKNLDQDDILTPGVLARDLAVLADPAIGWTTSRVLDLLPDGSTVGFDNDPDPGPLHWPFVVDHWRSHDYRAPVHPTTICLRRSLAVGLGGWMAVPGSDDTGLLIAASVASPGYFIGEVGLLYRKWPGQVSATAGHVEPQERALRMGLISERADQMADMLGLVARD